MARSSDTTRQTILDAAYRCFYREGFYRVSVDTIAAAAKVTKKTLYYHFPSKDDLLGAVLEGQRARALKLFEEAFSADEPDAGAAVRSIFHALGRWAERPGWHGPGFTRIALELADLPGHAARVAARRHKRAVEESVAAFLAARGVAEAGEGARQVVLLVEGASVLMLIHGDTGYAESAGAAAERLVTATRGEERRPVVAKRGASRKRAGVGHI